MEGFKIASKFFSENAKAAKVLITKNGKPFSESDKHKAVAEAIKLSPGNPQVVEITKEESDRVEAGLADTNITSTINEKVDPNAVVDPAKEEAKAAVDPNAVVDPAKEEAKAAVDPNAVVDPAKVDDVTAVDPNAVAPKKKGFLGI